MAQETTQAYLDPIENPNRLTMKLAYYFTRRHFGKVLTPLKVHSARLNVCVFCMDIEKSAAAKAFMNEAKFDALEQYQTSSLFSEKERVILDYVTELTQKRKVSPATFARLSEQCSEREICEVVWLVASEHLYNMTNIGLNIHSDRLCAKS